MTPTETATLAEFILQRIAEDEAVARAVPSEIREAYDRVVDRSEFWAYA